MKEEYWTKDQIERYCKRILGWKKLNVIYVPLKRSRGMAAAYSYYCTLVFCVHKLNRAILWHECGHLAKNEAGEMFNGEYFGIPSFLFKMGITNEKKIRQKIIENAQESATWEEVERDKTDAQKERDYIAEEVRAHLWAYNKALELGYTKVADELLQLLDSTQFQSWSVYRKVAKKVKQEVKKINKK